jgi:hypothetical protein
MGKEFFIMKQPRELLEQNLIKPTLEIKRRRGVVKDIKLHLSENHSIFGGNIQAWISNPAEELRNIDPRLLYLFCEQIYQKTGDQNINPHEYFTEPEIKTARQYSGKMFLKEELKFPLKFNHALESSRDSWIIMMDIKTIVALLKSRKLHWNPESQREATNKVVNGEIIEVATVHMHNVNEMKQLLKEGKLERTQLIFNASLGTSDEGEEIHYDKDSKELMITSGTKIDVIDGYHRCKAAELALEENPNINFAFEVKILNFAVDRAASYLAQISKGERMSEVKRRSMGKETNADIIVTDLQEKSVLRDRISKKEGLSTSKKELVTYNNLVSSIEKDFDLTSKVSRYETYDYLVEFFEVLFSYYEDEFTTNYTETKKTSLIADNNMFAGYVLLASRMKKEDIEPRHIYKYIKEIDFDKINPLWREIDVLDEKGRLTRNAKQNIEKYFSEIEL